MVYPLPFLMCCRAQPILIFYVQNSFLFAFYFENLPGSSCLKRSLSTFAKCLLRGVHFIVGSLPYNIKCFKGDCCDFVLKNMK